MKRNSYIHLIIDSFYILVICLPFIAYIVYLANSFSQDAKTFNDFILINDSTFLSGKICTFISNLFNIVYNGLKSCFTSVFSDLSITGISNVLNDLPANSTINFNVNSMFLYCANVVFFKIIFYIVDMVIALLTLPSTFMYVESD